MAIAFDAASNSGYQTAQSSYSWNHTCSGPEAILLVGVSMLSVVGSSVTSITYDGIALNLIDAKASVSGAVRAEAWKLDDPPTGTALSIVVTLSAGLDSTAGAVSLSVVNVLSSTEAANDNSATNIGAADATVTVTTVADNDWVFTVVAASDTSITAGQTERSNVTGTLGSGGTSTTGPKTPAGAQAMNWTNVGAAQTWSIVGVAIKPATIDTPFAQACL